MTLVAVAQAKKHFDKNKDLTDADFTRLECEWFFRNSYNLAVELCDKINPLHLASLASCASELTMILRSSAPTESHQGDSLLNASELAVHFVTCEYIAGLAYLVLARSDAHIDVTLRYYMKVRHHVQQAQREIETLVANSTSEDLSRSLIRKHFELVAHDLEAVLHLKQWDVMPTAFQECFKIKYESFDMDAKYLPVYADLAILIHEELAKSRSSAQHQTVVLSFLQSLINTAFQKSHDIQQLCKWIRCLFQMGMKVNDKLALQCLDQAIRIARSCKDSSTPYDAVELEWLSATAFNCAVDFYSAGDEANCRVWAETALSLAGEASDEGQFLKTLREKYSTLSWENVG